MKGLKLALAISVLISGSAFAESDRDYNHKKTYSMKDFGYHELKAMCGSSEDVGFTSVFGYPEEYKTNYPKMGQLLAEIEAIPSISSENKNFAKVRIQDGKDKKDAVYRMSSDTRGSMSKNMGYLKSSQALLEDTLEKYGAQKDQLQDESNFVSNDAVKDVIEKISYLPDGSGRYSINSGPTDHDKWKICLSWWNAGMPFYIKPVDDDDRHSGYYNPEGYKVGEKTSEDYLEHNENQRDEKLGNYNGGKSFSAEKDRIYQENGYADVKDDYGRVHQDKRWWDLVEEDSSEKSKSESNDASHEFDDSSQSNAWWKDKDRYSNKDIQEAEKSESWWKDDNNASETISNSNNQSESNTTERDSKAAMLRAIAEASLKNNAGRVENVHKKVQIENIKRIDGEDKAKEQWWK